MGKRISEWKPMGSQWTGRPRIRWLNDVWWLTWMTGKNWCWKGAWNDMVGKAKTHKGCKANGRRI
jgi:hypothetical protein